jgi:Tfp pilus assembly protein PilF
MSRILPFSKFIPPTKRSAPPNASPMVLAAAEQLHREGQIQAAFNGYFDLMVRYGPGTPIGNRAGFLAAIALYQQHHYTAAITLMLEVMGTDPSSSRWQNAELHYNLGIFYHASQQPARAIESYRTALALKPDMAAAENNMANALREVGETELAELCYSRLLNRNPDDPEARYNLAYITLMRGMLAKGFSLYEDRWRCVGYIAEYKRADVTSPRINYDNRQPCRLFVHQEQGIGDTLQFLRYLPRLVEMGHEVIFEAPIELGGWLERALHVDGVTVITRGTPIPAHDYHLPMMSLAYFVGTLEESDIPPVVRPGVTRPSPLWSDPGDTRPIIGVCWAGNAKHRNDHHRSTRLVDLAPLFAREDTRFVSLQVGARGAELMRELPNLTLGRGSEFIECSAQLSDFEATAALVQSCTAVVSVDTSILHLAGTLGVRTLALTSWLSEWRWQLDRTDSPWYPTVEVVRQPTLGDWSATAEQARRLLEAA